MQTQNTTKPAVGGAAAGLPTGEKEVPLNQYIDKIMKMAGTDNFILAVAKLAAVGGVHIEKIHEIAAIQIADWGKIEIKVALCNGVKILIEIDGDDVYAKIL